MENETKATRATESAKNLHQTIRDVGASLLSLPAYIEHTVLSNGGSPIEVVAITSALRYLCTALIKNDTDSIKSRCYELEISLVEAQKARLLNSAETPKENKTK
ncbi:MAG: hypothetical protein HC815_15125 [Richelia sp. RM1_1_1]|nr:hypothetical protein [Richelia sp. RM1_1_1]